MFLEFGKVGVINWKIKQLRCKSLPRISRIFTNLGVCKTSYFILSHEFSPDGELFCEYIMM